MDNADLAQPLRTWIPDIYERACEHAHNVLARWRGVNRPDTASLVDRAVYELLHCGDLPCESRDHALAILAQKSRQVSIDLARRLAAQKRGGAGRAGQADPVIHQSLEAGTAEATELPADRDMLLSMYEALEKLGDFSPRLRRVIELRFLLGLTVEETATELDSTVATVKRDTQLAKAWLYNALKS
jgi:RNA polymerase sigma factor (TIGR02999 family)